MIAQVLNARNDLTTVLTVAMPTAFLESPSEQQLLTVRAHGRALDGSDRKLNAQNTGRILRATSATNNNCDDVHYVEGRTITTVLLKRVRRSGTVTHSSWLTSTHSTFDFVECCVQFRPNQRNLIRAADDGRKHVDSTNTNAELSAHLTVVLCHGLVDSLSFASLSTSLI